MKYLLLTLLLFTVGLVSYDSGYLMPHVVKDPTAGLHEVACDDIVRDPNGKLVCEVTMRAEDDNLKIFREERNVQ